MSDRSAAREQPRDSLLAVRNLKKYYQERTGVLETLIDNATPPVRAVDGVSFDIEKGETVGLVGESGCGKSTLGETILQLQEPTDGRVFFDGKDVGEMGNEEVRAFQQATQVVFQDPFDSLNPRMTVGEIVREPMSIQGWKSPGRRDERSLELLERVGLSREHSERYPHEFSGGQRQRIAIARALGTDPEFVVLDEPTSALDVSVQAQILNLLEELQDEFDLTYLCISHNLGVVRYISDRIAVMYLGKIVELGPAEQVCTNPGHPYTEALLESVPRADPKEREKDADDLPGNVPSPRSPPSGCRFRTRCPEVIPPAAYDLSREEFRAVMNLRDLLEQDERHGNVLSSDGGDEVAGDDPATSEPRDEIRDELGLPSLQDENAETELLTALSLVARGEREKAKSRLATAFETVCETREPVLEETTAGHLASCHLRDGSER